MKTPLLSSLALSLLLSCPIHGQSKEVDPFSPAESAKARADVRKQVRVLVEYIEISHELMNDLMFGEKSGASDADLRKELSKLIKEKKAKIVETQICTTRPGTVAHSKSQEEFTYPTEYDPAEAFPNPVDKHGEAQQNTHKVHISAVGPNPTAFETRDLGPSLKIQPILHADDKRLTLLMDSEIAEHTGSTVWAEWKGPHGESPVQMPTFYTLQVKTSLTLVPGEPMLAAALTPKDEKGKSDPSRKLLVFARAHVTTLGE